MNRNNIEAAYEYDAAGELLKVSHKGMLEQGNYQRDFQYTYDQAGNRTAMTDPGGTHEYGYDDRYQLTSATYPTTPSESFGYDSVGNRTASHISPSYTYDAGNQLLEDTEFTYMYDADGNCTRKVSKLDGTRHEYVFNSENRMTGYRKYDVSSTLLTTADYFYDAVGRRMAKQVDGSLTRYINREEDIVMVLPQSSSPIFYWHGPGIDEPIASVAGDQGYFNDMGGYWTYYFLTDGLGSVREVRLHAPWQIGVLVLAPLYDSFGQILTSPPAPDSALNLFLYTGRQLDAETGLYYLRSRYYDPHTGRFVGEDPLPDVNLYTYVHNNPLRYRDPFGLQEAEDPCGDRCDSSTCDSIEDCCDCRYDECMKRPWTKYDDCVEKAKKACEKGGCKSVCKMVPLLAKWACKKFCEKYADKPCDEVAKWVCDKLGEEGRLKECKADRHECISSGGGMI